MKTCNKDENWLEGVFENENIGETLSKLTKEFDCLISSDKGGKQEDNSMSTNKTQNIDSEDKRQSPENLQPKPKAEVSKQTDSLQSSKSSSKSATKNRRGSKTSMTSQLPKPVECIEVETEDHYCVPPVVVDGEVVRNFQYLTLHEPKKFFCDEIVERPKKLKFLQQTSKKISHAISNVLRTNQNTKKKGEKSPLKELYNETFNIEQVGDLDSKIEYNKVSQKT